MKKILLPIQFITRENIYCPTCSINLNFKHASYTLKCHKEGHVSNTKK